MDGSQRGMAFADDLMGDAYTHYLPENQIFSACQQCNTNCGIKVKIKDGVVKKIDDNPYSPWCMTPQKIVRLTSLGFIEELLDSPEIWYCLTCRRCLQICPSQVKPFDIIDFVRQEAVSRGIVSYSSTRRLQLLFAQLQRVRWRAFEQCLSGVRRTKRFRSPIHHSHERSRSIDLFVFSGYGE
ncbi:MAG: hypothetical protein V1844_25705 [Pseudomonadota bacterium]